MTRIGARLATLARNLFRRNAIERDLDDELRAYVANLAAEQHRRGLSPNDAHRSALIDAGVVERLKDDVRDVRSGETVGIVARDFRYAARGLLGTPGFTIAAVLALALGIGANTAMLSVVNGVLLRPLAYKNPNGLVVLLLQGHNPMSPGTFEDWRTQTRSFDDMAAAEAWSPNLIGVEQPEHITALRFTAGMFPLLGVSPLLGRVFTTSEDVPGSEHVAVISYGLWQRRFGGEQSVIGRQVMLNGAQTTIIGVMPKTFQFAPFWATHAELWAPLALGARAADHDGGSLRVFARLSPSATLEQARRDLAAVSARIEQQFPGTSRDATVEPLKDKVIGNVQTPLLVLLAAVAFVLLIACANVAHMLLARAASRQRELGIRAALGATRARLVAQQLSESVLLAIVGGAAGILLAVLGLRALVAASPSSIPRVATVSIDLSVLGATIAITFVTAIFFGLVPAIGATQLDLADTFRDGDRATSDSRERGRLRSVLVASEFALALVLLVGAGLMIRSVAALQHVDPGFDPHNVLTLSVSVTGTREADSAVRSTAYTEILTRVRSLPGVQAASWINHLPIAGDEWGFPFVVEGRPLPAPGATPTATYRVVFPGYFGTMRIPILHGRDVDATDRPDAPRVVLVNEFMAKTYWPGETAVGKRISFNRRDWVTVVGVVKNTVREEWSAPAEEELFVPFAQDRDYQAGKGSEHGYLSLVVRAACSTADRCDAAAAVFAPSIVSAVRAVDRNLPISEVQTMNAVVAGATAEMRLYLVLLASFAAIAVSLASVGIYGVMSYTVARRTHEIGIRVALGAQPSSVLRMIVRQGMAVALSGAAVGIGAALLLTRLMGGVLFGVAPRDPLTFGVGLAALSAVAMLASYVPARRATRTDPLVALRTE